MVIPASVLESLSATPASQQMRDAAAELAFRIAHGEYDDLDDSQRMDLQALSQILDSWARRVAELEEIVCLRDPRDEAPRAKP